MSRQLRAISVLALLTYLAPSRADAQSSLGRELPDSGRTGCRDSSLGKGGLAGPSRISPKLKSRAESMRWGTITGIMIRNIPATRYRFMHCGSTPSGWSAPKPPISSFWPI